MERGGGQYQPRRQRSDLGRCVHPDEHVGHPDKAKTADGRQEPAHQDERGHRQFDQLRVHVSPSGFVSVCVSSRIVRARSANRAKATVARNPTSASASATSRNAALS